jgi:SAM-dependent methyltransferase
VNRAKLQILQARAYYDLAAAQSGPLVALGERLGLYAALASPLTSTELAAATGIDERSLQPWLTNQVAAGYVTRIEDRYSLDDEQREVLRRLAPAFVLATELAANAREVEAAMRANRGMTFGPQVTEAIAGLDPSRAQRVFQWLRFPPGDLLEIGCGDGTLLRALVDEYPEAHCTGIDLVPTGASADRITILAGDALALPAGPFDTVLTIDTFHELADPAAVARAVREILTHDGVWIVAEPRAPEAGEESPAAARLLSSLELLYCLPASLAHGTAGLGPSTPASRYLEILHAAGFTRNRQIEDRDQTVLEARP